MTLAEVQAELSKLKAARDEILTGAQNYAIGNRQLTRGSLMTINAEIKRYEALEVQLNARSGGMTVRGITPV